MQADDSYWRRPEPPDRPAGDPAELATDADPPYQAPPPMLAPPADWRPGYLVEDPPPRQLPQQDHARMDEEEVRARTVTLTVASVAGVALLLLVCWLCGSALF